MKANRYKRSRVHDYTYIKYLEGVNPGVVLRGLGEPKIGRHCSVGTGFYCSAMEMIWN